MNILFLSRDYPPKLIGGVGIYVYEASRLLAKLGHKVYLITEAIEYPLEYIDQGVHVFRVKIKRLGIFDSIRNRLFGFVDRLEYSHAVSRKIKEVVLRYPVDIIESSEARAEGFFYYFLRNKPPLVIKLHTSEGIVYQLNRDPVFIERRLIEKLEEWWIFRAKRLIGLSESINNLTGNYYKIKCKNIPVVSNPIDINVFKPQDSTENKGYVLYAGRLEFRKGVHVLIRAVPRVLERVPDAKFIFIGNDCGMKEYLIKKITEFGIRDSVEFIDQVPREDLVSFYQQSAICVVPSLWENQPYTVLEAMACGKPVIAGAAGGIPEIIKDEINGVLVPAGSVLSLADSISNVLLDRGRQERLGRNARKYIQEQYASDKVIQKTLDVYKELLN